MRIFKILWGFAQIGIALMFGYWEALYFGSFFELSIVPKIEPLWVFFALLNSFFYFGDRAMRTFGIDPDE